MESILRTSTELIQLLKNCYYEKKLCYKFNLRSVELCLLKNI